MKYVIYTRVSKLKDEESISHEMQLQKCLDIVKGEQYLAFQESNISGDTDVEKCPKLYEALSCLKPGDIFIIWKMDRLSRDLLKMAKILAAVEKKKSIIVSATEPNFFDNNVTAKMIRNITMAIAEYELGSIRLRVKTALEAKKKKGLRVGYIPYGYRVIEGNRLVADETEQFNLDLMAQLYIEKGLTYREVAASLNNGGIPNRSGHQWSRMSVFRILKNRSRHAEAYLRKPEPLHI